MKKLLFTLFTLIFLVQICMSQNQPAAVGSAEKKAVVDAVASILQKQYVFPDTARKMGDLIKKNLKAGKYTRIDDPRAFALKLTEDLRSLSRDRHLGVRFAPELIREMKTPDEAIKKAAEKYQKKLDRLDNHGFKEVKILSGNVGYLKFNHFSAAQEAFRVAVGAMAFLANCDALIVDLRENGGGNPEMIQLLSSYFFSGEPRHLNSFYHRMDEKTEQFWTLPYVPGSKLAETDLYVLTSRYTFSGAEEFTYNMKNLKRATVIGETTGGGAHPTSTRIVQHDYVLRVPFARAINPVSKTNWEGTGVTPDIAVPAAEAFDRAYALAVEKLAAKSAGTERKAEYEWILAGEKARKDPPRIDEKILKIYAGEYGERKVLFENGGLFYQRTGPKYRLVSMTATLFAVEGLDYFRLEFVVKNGKAVELVGLYDNGDHQPSPRTK